MTTLAGEWQPDKYLPTVRISITFIIVAVRETLQYSNLVSGLLNFRTQVETDITFSILHPPPSLNAIKTSGMDLAVTNLNFANFLGICDYAELNCVYNRYLVG